MRRTKTTGTPSLDGTEGYKTWATEVANAFNTTPLSLPTDTYSSYQWHLYNQGQTGGVAGIDLNISKAWDLYDGTGVKVGILDDGFDYSHSDLARNVSTTLDYDFRDMDATARAESGDFHGTMVAGVIGAAKNGTGMVGVAYDTTLVGYRMGFGADGGLDQIANAFTTAKNNVDILNNSWGFTTAYSDDARYMTDVFNPLTDLAVNGRGGLGTAVVFAAGNSASTGDNTNYHNLNNSPYTIVVGALDASGKAASFTTPGASVLVSAPGVSIGTTDGVGANGAVSGDYALASGTSFATPMVSGVIALMLEANPNLGARDIQEILVLSARPTDYNTDSWQTVQSAFVNDGTLHFSHQLGFGLLDANTAVHLAETWTATSTFANADIVTATNTTSVLLADNGITQSSLDVTENQIIDRVAVTVDLSHARASDLELYLIAPDGTRSLLADNAPVTGAYVSGFTYTTVADWGAQAAGTWTLEVRDTVAGTTGTLNSWELTFIGDKDTTDDTYYVTNQFSAFDTSAYVFHDTDGGLDTVNLSAVSTSSRVALESGYTNQIADRAATFDGSIENACLGDGNDLLCGTAGANLVFAGRGTDLIRGADGNDILYGQDGNDRLYGDAGNDTLYGGAGLDYLLGGTGADRFVIDTLDGNLDRVCDFNRMEGDIVDISALLSGYNPLDSLEQWLSCSQSGNNAVLSVSQTGNGVFTEAVALTNIQSNTLDLYALTRQGLIDLIA